jgi:nucleoside-diphosphate-sugar epimerase
MHDVVLMQAFIAGATGVLGRRVVKKLLSRGHRVAALVRSDANEALIRELGAEPRRADIFQATAVERTSGGADAILHLATAIPVSARTSRADWKLNDRLRREGTKNLLKAAALTGARLYLQQSITFLYGDRGGEWVDEASPVSGRLAPVLESAADMEAMVRAAPVPSVILRFGAFYAHDAAHTRMLFEMARKNQAVVISGGKNYTNPIHVDDAAEAVCQTIERADSAAGETFNICDDEPATTRAIVDLVCEELGARGPRSLPRFVAKWALGAHLIDSIVASVRVKNGKARERLDFTPRHPTFREGYRGELASWRESQ